MIRAIIVDDEFKSRSTLRKLLADYCPAISIAGEAENITDAATLIEKENPALVFLDIEMPYGSGFDLLDSLPVINFEVVFVTAYNQYALDAFRYASIDYLLKPLNIDQLKNTVERVKQRLIEKESVANYQLLLEKVKQQQEEHKRIQLSGNREQYLVKCTDILYCIAEGSYTFVYIAGGRKFHSSKNLKYFENELPASLFYRIHNGHLVNLQQITKVIKGHGGSVIMSDGKELEIAVRRKEEFLALIK